MSRIRPLIATGAVALLVGLILGTLASGSPASAQEKPHVGPRYHLETYAYGQDSGQAPGAYVLDVDTGEVFRVNGSSKLTRVGSVREAR